MDQAEQSVPQLAPPGSCGIELPEGEQGRPRSNEEGRMIEFASAKAHANDECVLARGRVREVVAKVVEVEHADAEQANGGGRKEGER